MTATERDPLAGLPDGFGALLNGAFDVHVHGQRLLITHPLHYTRDPRELRQFTELGAFVEFAGAPLLHPDSRLSVRDVHEAMSALGPDRIVLSTDAFSRWAPPEPECLRMFAEQLAYLGWQPTQLSQMTAGNPRAFLGLMPPEKPGEPGD